MCWTKILKQMREMEYKDQLFVKVKTKMSVSFKQTIKTYVKKQLTKIETEMRRVIFIFLLDLLI